MFVTKMPYTPQILGTNEDNFKLYVHVAVSKI